MLTKAISIAQSYKIAEKNATELLPQDANSQPVYRVQPAPVTGAPSKRCNRCGKAGHWLSACCFKKERCGHNCNKVGHIKRACTAPSKGIPVRNVQLVSESDTTNTNFSTVVGHEYHLFTVTASQTPPIVIPVKINDKQIQMELDTRSAVSLVSEDTYKLHWPEQQLQQSSDKLKTYSGEYLDVLYSTKHLRDKTFAVRSPCEYSQKNYRICIKTMSNSTKAL